MNIICTFICTLSLVSVFQLSLAAENPNQWPVEQSILTSAPEVPPVIKRDRPAKVIVNLEVKEVEKELADGVIYTFWTYGGSVPGKFIRVREGDYVEFHLQNHPSSKVPHNIDLHAVTGPGGGAASSFTAPGHGSVFSFMALNPGLYVYHCATAPVGMHIGNGMYGLIYVQPKQPLPKVDREIYIMQGEFYTKGKNGEIGHQPFSMQKALDERPEYVVFNGSVGSFAGDKAIPFKVGESVRLFVGNGGPNLTSSFHVIGEIFDRVYTEGGTSPNQQNVQTTLIPPGGSAIAEFKLDVPGSYVVVDHAIFRAFNKGALGILSVKGDENKLIYSGKTSDEVYQPEGSVIQEDLKKVQAPLVAKTKAERFEYGRRIYTQSCAACHQTDGKGIAQVFPPLAKSDFLNADKKRAIEVILRGRNGEIKVNDNTYVGQMPAQVLNDEEVANVLTFVYGSWENKGHLVTSEEVRATRKSFGK